MSEPLPEREVEQTHQCVCQLLDKRGNPIDQCGVIGLPMDVPFCESCEEAGHPDLPNQRPVMPERTR